MLLLGNHASPQGVRRPLSGGFSSAATPCSTPNPLPGGAALQLPVPLFTLDDAQARQSVAKLAELPVGVLCCGHSEPILEGAQEKMRALLTSEIP